jgi:hypothetical protein
MNKTDCGRCCCFDYYQDTDDEGREIAPPIYSCGKGHEVFPEFCEDFEDCWSV